MEAAGGPSIIGNHANREGGGIWTSGPVRMVGGSIEANDGRVLGGGVRVAGAGSIELVGVLVSGNTPADLHAAAPVTVDGVATFTCDLASCQP